MVFQISALIISLIFGGVYYYLTKIKVESKIENVDNERLTAQEFVNIKDVKDKYAYSKDGYVFMYIKINGISVDLLSNREQKQLKRQLTAELSSDNDVLKFTAISRPVDITPLVNEYNELLMNSTDIIQKKLLKQEMKEINNYAMSGDIVERQFVQHLWHVASEDAESELNKRASDIVSIYENNGMECNILNEQEIRRYLNLFSNPAYINLEDTDVEATIPVFSNAEVV